MLSLPSICDLRDVLLVPTTEKVGKSKFKIYFNHEFDVKVSEMAVPKQMSSTEFLLLHNLVRR